VKQPEWPSPHDCTSSVLDELVLIQLLILVQSQRLSHTFFFGLSFNRFFFFTCGPPLLTQLPCSKQNSRLPCSSTYVTDFFFKALFLLAVIVNGTIVQSLIVIADVQRRTRNCLKVWATQCAIFSRRHQNKVCLLQFFLHLWFLYIFNLGLGLWDLCFECF